MGEPEPSGGLYRREALDYYARRDRQETASFNPVTLLPRWRSVVAGAVLIAVLGFSGLCYAVHQGAVGIIADVGQDSVVVGFANASPDLSAGEPVVLAFPDGARIDGFVAETEVVSGGGITATMILVDLETFGSAVGRENQNVTVNPSRVPLLYDIIEGNGAGRA